MLRLAFLFVVVLGGCQSRTRPPVNSFAVLMEALPPLGRVSARAVAQEWVPCSPSVLVVEQDRGWFRWRMDPGAGLQRPQTEPMILVLSPWVDNIPSPDLACGVLEVGTVPLARDRVALVRQSLETCGERARGTARF